MTIRALFTDHPASVGETYVEHCGVALSFSTGLLRASLACAVHAFLPFLFRRTASAAVADLHHRMVVARSRRTAQVQVPGTVA